MKKLFLLSLIAVMTMVSKSFAQSNLVATLSHEGAISTFYGTSAFQKAYDAAVNGDAITLSSGSFTAVNINKALTIRGAGMEPNPTTGSMPTILIGDFIINGWNYTGLTIEGIYHNSKMRYQNELKNAKFIKCRFNFIASRQDGNMADKMTNCSFIHCKIASSLYLYSTSDVSCIGCVIVNPQTFGETSKFEMANCYLYVDCNYVRRSTIRNCIIDNWYNGDTFDSNNTLFNNVGATNSGINPFKDCTNGSNTAFSNYTDFMNTFFDHSKSIDDMSFELTGTAQTSYLGLDGTQVGIYGGSLPFDPTVSGPQITRCNVASKSTADGKLSVDIEVSVNQ